MKAIKNIKKNQIEVLKLKEGNNNNNKLTDGLNNRMEMAEYH